MVQGTPDDAPSIQIGDRFRLTLRRYALERGVPVYGFKAVTGGSLMGWDKVAVVGAGMIKFGELFEQSYEQMAQGAFRAAIASVDKGLDPSDIDAGIVATQRGSLWGQEGVGGNTVAERRRSRRSAVHPSRERVPFGF